MSMCMWEHIILFVTEITFGKVNHTTIIILCSPHIGQYLSGTLCSVVMQFLLNFFFNIFGVTDNKTTH